MSFDPNQKDTYPRNKRCFCGSGKKYRKCCQPGIAASTADMLAFHDVMARQQLPFGRSLVTLACGHTADVQSQDHSYPCLVCPKPN